MGTYSSKLRQKKNETDEEFAIRRKEYDAFHTAVYDYHRKRYEGSMADMAEKMKVSNNNWSHLVLGGGRDVHGEEVVPVVERLTGSARQRAEAEEWIQRQGLPAGIDPRMVVGRLYVDVGLPVKSFRILPRNRDEEWVAYKRRLRAAGYSVWKTDVGVRYLKYINPGVALNALAQENAAERTIVRHRPDSFVGDVFIYGTGWYRVTGIDVDPLIAGMVEAVSITNREYYDRRQTRLNMYIPNAEIGMVFQHGNTYYRVIHARLDMDSVSEIISEADYIEAINNNDE